MKIYSEGKEFKPYKITIEVETEFEHRLLFRMSKMDDVIPDAILNRINENYSPSQDKWLMEHGVIADTIIKFLGGLSLAMLRTGT